MSQSFFSKVWEPIMSLVFPFYFMFLASLYLPDTIASLLLSRDFQTLLSPPALKFAWFARFWAVYGPLTREGSAPRVEPLIRKAEGVVVEVGPGGGEWVGLYDKERVTKIYGVEPNKDHHEGLRKKIKEAGLSDVYVIVPVGVEELGEKWVKMGEVDSIVTIQCLCSIPTPKLMIDTLYTYLKPGGQWIIYEHVIAHSPRFIASYQWAIDFIWPHFLGGCSITRDTEKFMRGAGQWKDVDLKKPEDEPKWAVLPHVMGVLTK